MNAQQLIYITEGSRIILKDKAYRYAYAFFALERPDIYMYTYAYQEEEHWCTYKSAYSSNGFLKEDREFAAADLPPSGEGYIKITVETDKGEPAENRVDILEIQDGPCTESRLKKKEKDFLLREDVQEEVSKTVRSIREKYTPDCLSFTLLADTHYVINGSWETCAATIEAVNSRIRPDGIIHLGDLTDGILDKEICRDYSHRVLNRIGSWDIPVYMTIGNHDVNYFKRNPDILSEEEQYRCYLQDVVSGRLTEGQLWYHADFPKQKLRFLFLHSYDNAEKLRYGFPQEELDWVQKQLKELPEGCRIILFSHDAPLAGLDYWAKEIRNGEALTEMLDRWNAEHDNRIMAFIHGHTHTDYIYRKRTFPIVSVGCSKIEYFEDKKPKGAVTPVRIEGTVSQELWDTMIVNTKTGKINLVRFGAGTDREITTDNQINTKIWAHRGASGYAPENTLEAFALAQELGADGVELDVQFTKDRQLVVLHDERIDRVSDGKGLIADYTLEEVQKFHFNRTHPEYTEAKIPTLRQVLEFLKPTRLTVNIELKTGINFYPGIEKAAVQLVQELEMEERVIYSSFNHASVMKVKELAPEARTGFLYCDGTLDMPEYAMKHGADALHPARYDIKYPGFVEACREHGIRLHVWTVNDKPEMEQMLQLGVDAIITNYPDRAYEVIHGQVLPVPEPPKPEKETEPTVAQQPQETDGKTQPEQAAAEDTAEAAQMPMENMSEAKQISVKKKNGLLHLAGVTYGRVRKVFVAIDQAVQRAAGK